MPRKNIVEFTVGNLQPSTQPSDAFGFDAGRKKPPKRSSIAPEERILVGREEAAQLLSISQRALDYLLADGRLPVRRIGGRVLIPVADLRRYAHCDHLENIVTCPPGRAG